VHRLVARTLVAVVLRGELRSAADVLRGVTLTLRVVVSSASAASLLLRLALAQFDCVVEILLLLARQRFEATDGRANHLIRLVDICVSLQHANRLDGCARQRRALRLFLALRHCDQ